MLSMTQTPSMVQWERNRGPEGSAHSWQYEYKGKDIGSDTLIGEVAGWCGEQERRKVLELCCKSGGRLPLGFILSQSAAHTPSQLEGRLWPYRFPPFIFTLSFLCFSSLSFSFSFPSPFLLLSPFLLFPFSKTYIICI